MPRISLSNAVGRAATVGNRLSDTLKLKLGLERLGYYEPGEKGFVPGPDDELWHGLQSYQRDRGLEVDGIALPEGPTVAALNDDLDTLPASPIVKGRFDASISPEAANSNRRTVQALARSNDVGDLPAFVVSALKSGSAEAPAEVVDLLAQSHKTKPDQAGRLRSALEDYLDADDLSRLDSAVRGTVGPEWDQIRARTSEEPIPPTPISRASMAEESESPPEQRPAGHSSESGDPFDALLGKLYPREGGYMIDPTKGETFKGVTEDTLKTYNKLHPEKGFPDKVTEMTEEQRADFYRNEFYERPQIDKLARIRGLQEAAPQLAEQMFDAGVLHGPETAGKWLQAALDRYTGSHLVRDGIMGRETRNAIEKAIRNGTITDVNNMVVDQRLEAMRNHPKSNDYRGWPKRAESFRR